MSDAVSSRKHLLALLFAAALTLGYGARVAEEALSAHPFNPVAFAAERYRAARAWVEQRLSPPANTPLLVSGGSYTGTFNFIVENSAGGEQMTLYDGGANLLALYGTSGKAIVTVRRDGSVDLTGNPNEAARVFWQSVGTLSAVGARCP